METAIVIVALAAGYLWRNVARSMKSGGHGCGCGGCSACPMATRQKQSCGK